MTAAVIVRRSSLTSRWADGEQIGAGEGDRVHVPERLAERERDGFGRLCDGRAVRRVGRHQGVVGERRAGRQPGDADEADDGERGRREDAT